MRAYVDYREANVHVDIAVKVSITMEPGLWIVREPDERTYSVTSLQGLIDAEGQMHLAYPRGVPRRPSGAWASREEHLQHAVPRTHPASSWQALPEGLRSAIEDAYVLAVSELPGQVGGGV